MGKSFDTNRFYKVGGKFRPTPEYSTWQHMKQRCLNPNSYNYPHYGGRGIKICERWLNSFDNFLEDMGKRPADNYSIDRIDNNGDYCPENCKWSNIYEQVGNRSITVKAELNGEIKSLADWCRQLNLSYDTTLQHIRKDGLNLQESIALKNTVRKNRKSSYDVYSKELLLELYIKQDKTRPELAKILGVSERTASKALAKLGITKYKHNRGLAKKLQLSIDL